VTQWSLDRGHQLYVLGHTKARQQPENALTLCSSVAPPPLTSSWQGSAVTAALSTYLGWCWRLKQVPKVTANCHLLGDAGDALPRIVHQVDCPFGWRHVQQHQALAVMHNAVTAANAATPHPPPHHYTL